MTTDHRRRDVRNLKPHGEAMLARAVWGAEYSRQRLGCMDWYDTLSEARKQQCRKLLDDVAAARRERSLDRAWPVED